jgi:hypothetical protein
MVDDPGSVEFCLDLERVLGAPQKNFASCFAACRVLVLALMLSCFFDAIVPLDEGIFMLLRLHIHIATYYLTD